MILGIVFIVLGLFLLLSALGIVVNVNVWSIIGAVILLAIGVKLIIKPKWCPMCSGGWKMHSKMHGGCCGHHHDEEDTQD
jgi:predicted tellurium resistance membrane protein TerC